MPKFPPAVVTGQVLIDKSGEPLYAFKRWLETVQQWLSNGGAPATKTSAGTQLQIQGLETDGTYLYVAVGTNRWKRVLLSDF